MRFILGRSGIEKFSLREEVMLFIGLINNVEYFMDDLFCQVCLP
jgi:hypothetical protein